MSDEYVKDTNTINPSYYEDGGIPLLFRKK